MSITIQMLHIVSHELKLVQNSSSCYSSIKRLQIYISISTQRYYNNLKNLKCVKIFDFAGYFGENIHYKVFKVCY